MAQVQCAQRGCPGQQGRGGQGILSRGEREELRSKTEILNPGRTYQSYLGSFVERLISPHCPYPPQWEIEFSTLSILSISKLFHHSKYPYFEKISAGGPEMFPQMESWA